MISCTGGAAHPAHPVHPAWVSGARVSTERRPHISSTWREHRPQRSNSGGSPLRVHLSLGLLTCGSFSLPPQQSAPQQSAPQQQLTFPSLQPTQQPNHQSSSPLHHQPLSSASNPSFHPSRSFTMIGLASFVLRRSPNLHLINTFSVPGRGKQLATFTPPGWGGFARDWSWLLRSEICFLSM